MQHKGEVIFRNEKHGGQKCALEISSSVPLSQSIIWILIICLTEKGVIFRKRSLEVLAPGSWPGYGSRGCVEHCSWKAGPVPCRHFQHEGFGNRALAQQASILKQPEQKRP